ncbi:MAG TPA: signal recognition particle protein [Candidatus Aminicenantes bacterium]|nr:signal recognition particle protein [Candidatus Aminicenantes bacterium]HRY63741.1 signal recognition particle protein [Candidatus Aminicenantes bacterium]HRZ70654.1 signal recognition particle protein [Candidatus Aminicenantes bacterium]
MFEQLSGRLEKMLKFLRGEVKVTDKNMAEALKMMRLAFLEADVNYKVVKDFEARIRERAAGEEVLGGLNPAQQVIKIVHDELTGILGGGQKPLQFSPHPPSVLMLVGLQGSGKTTTSGKLARWVTGIGKHPLLVSFDLKRPAAQDQLRTIAAGLNVPFYEMTAAPMASPKEALKELLTYTANRGFDPLIVDTAGRLHIDDELMDELRLVKDILAPVETIYVGDAMTGQDAVRSAQTFEERIGLTAVILTKLDGDARGGAALSIVAATGRPIKFVGVGEKSDKLEVFHPERMASRILGLGDILSLIEKAQDRADLAEAEEMARKLRKQEFTLEDFKKQIVQIRKMGSLQDLLGHLPQAGPLKALGRAQVDERRVAHFAAIIDSMTPAERADPKRVLNGSRRARIARGSGRPVQEVNQLVKQFLEMRKMMKGGAVQKLLGKL